MTDVTTLDVDAVKAFVTIADLQSFTRAADALGTTQGAISVKLKRLGAHCLRHACASQLLDAGFTLKQIADHLGHRSLNTTRIYTKIDLNGLRQVAELDLGGLL